MKSRALCSVRCALCCCSGCGVLCGLRISFRMALLSMVRLSFSVRFMFWVGARVMGMAGYLG